MRSHRARRQHAEAPHPELVAVAVGTEERSLPPQIGEPRNGGELIGDAHSENEALATKLLTIYANDEPTLDGRGRARERLSPRDRRVRQYLRSPLDCDRCRRLSVLPEKAVRVAGEAVSSLARIHNEHAPPSPAQLQRRR